jgi:hypothetical protein
VSTQSLPSSIGSTVTRAGLAAGCGGAGSLAALAVIHKHSAPAVAAGAVTAAFAVSAAASAVRSLAGAINAIGSLLSTVIRARADAKATIIHAKVRAELARAGLDPNKTTQAAEMQRILSVNPALPRDRRPADETLIKLHGTTPPAPPAANQAPTTRQGGKSEGRCQQGRPLRSDP